MKKIFIVLVASILMTGCSITKEVDNTPTKKVESLLNNYQTLDSSVNSDLDKVVNEESSFNDKQKETYKDLIKSNYQKMTYKIKETKEDGDEAVVTAEIEVIDFTKILNETKLELETNPKDFETDDVYDNEKYLDYRLDKLKDAKDKITYTVDFYLTKVDDEWVVDDLTDEIRSKINGVYEQ